jgi:hypothetical protein
MSDSKEAKEVKESKEVVDVEDDIDEEALKKEIGDVLAPKASSSSSSSSASSASATSFDTVLEARLSACMPVGMLFDCCQAVWIDVYMFAHAILMTLFICMRNFKHKI